jgi:hypothetical protein
MWCHLYTIFYRDMKYLPLLHNCTPVYVIVKETLVFLSIIENGSVLIVRMSHKINCLQ